MLDFTVPNNPGWGKRTLESQGSEDQIGAISPKMLAAIDALQRHQNHVTEAALLVHETAHAFGLLAIEMSAQATGLSQEDDVRASDLIPLSR